MPPTASGVIQPQTCGPDMGSGQRLSRLRIVFSRVRDARPHEKRDTGDAQRAGRTRAERGTLACTVRFGVEGCQQSASFRTRRMSAYVEDSRRGDGRHPCRGAGRRRASALRPGLIALAVGIALCWGLGELFSLDVERFVGLRYLHRGRRTRASRVTLAVSGMAFAVCLVLFVTTRGRTRLFETVAVIGVLGGGLVVIVGFLLRFFSVFTAVSTMGVVWAWRR